MEALTEKKNILAQFDSLFGQRGLGTDPLRRQAMNLLLSKGLPTSKTEEYRFTPITRALESLLDFNAPAHASAPANPSLELIRGMPCNLLAFVNGQYSTGHSKILDAAITITHHATMAPCDGLDPFDLLNYCFSGPMVQIEIPENQVITHPVVVVYYFDSPSFVFANPRWTCSVGAGSRLSMVEYTMANGLFKYFNNKQSRIAVGANAELEFITIQHGDESEVHVNNSFIDLSTSARAICHTLTLGGYMVRNNLTLTLNGENIDARLNGLYLAAGNTLIDNHTVVDHRKPNSYSNELYKGVIDGHAKAVFNGKIFVRPEAQKTNAFQSNRNILLSETAAIHTKPQLEIWADDVKCSHGCTTGQLDEEAMFYLRSRGLSKDMTKGILLYAFAVETLTSLQNPFVKNFADQLISTRLNHTA